MCSCPEHRSDGGRLFVALIAGFLWAFSIPPFDFGVLACVLMFPLLLWSIDGASLRSSVKAGFVFACAGIGTGCWWLVNVFGPAGLLLVPVAALNQLVFVLGARLLLRRRHWTGFFQTALLWSAVEFVRVEWAPLGNATLTVGSSVPSGLPCFPARYVGIYGLGFLYVLFGALLYRIFRCWVEGRDVRQAAIPLVLMFAVFPVLCWIASPPGGNGAGTVKTLAVQAQRVPLSRLLEMSEQALQGMGTGTVDLVVWPEWAIRDVFVEEDADVLATLSSFCRRYGVCLVFGNKKRSPGGGFFNTAFLMDSSGRLAGSQGKARPVPFLGDGEPTVDPSPVKFGRFGSVGLPICYDADFSSVLRGIAARGAAFFVVPTSDNRRWGWFQHEQRARILRLRAVETGRYVLRVNGSGPTVLVGPDGRYVDCLWRSGEGVLRTSIPVITGEGTFYVRHGAWIGPLMVILSVLSIIPVIGTVGGGRSS